MKKAIFQALVVLALGLAAAAGIYLWFFCRFYVPPEHIAVVTAKGGREPVPGTILVERGEKGLWREIFPEGRHFLDPVMYDVTIVPAVNIPLGKVGVVTSKVGKPLPPSEIIAPDREHQGVWREALGPGLYRLNPQGYQVDIVDAVNIPIGYVGVVTSQTGEPAAKGDFAAVGRKGVMKDILQPGLYYLNPRANQVNVIEIGMNQVSMTGQQGSVIAVKRQIESTNVALQEMSASTLGRQQKSRRDFFQQQEPADSRPAAPRKPQQQLSDKVAATPPQGEVYSISGNVEFPSRDGFKITMDMTVEFELLPDNVSRIYMLFGDLPQVVANILLPQILSASRLKGSSYKAQDFIMGDGRETFQKNLRSELVTSMGEKNIIIHNAIIRNVSIPDNILKPIQDSSIAGEQNLTNVSLQEAAKIEADLNSQNALIEQKQREVEQETRKMVAEVAANQQNEVRLIDAQAELEAARFDLERSVIEARMATLLGEAEVKADFIKKNELAAGTRLKAEALGTLGLLADLKLIDNLNPNLKIRIVHAGEGTLWTDLKSAALQVTPTAPATPAPAADTTR